MKKESGKIILKKILKKVLFFNGCHIYAVQKAAFQSRINFNGRDNSLVSVFSCKKFLNACIFRRSKRLFPNGFRL